MNLLGHFVCAAHLSSSGQAGSVLGDLLPLYDRRARVLPLAKAWEAGQEQTPEMADLVAGVQFHLKVDSTFHRDPLFMETYSAILKALEQAGPRDGLKRFLPAHVLTELFLDHLLLKQDERLGDAFHALLAEPNRGLMIRFAGRDPRVDATQFGMFLEKITEEQFVLGYRDVEGVIGRMQRILVRFGQRTLRPPEVAAVLEAFSVQCSRAQAALLQFVATLRQAGGALQHGASRGRALAVGVLSLSIT